MNLLALLKEKVGFSSSGNLAQKGETAPLGRDYTPYELDLITQELRSNNALAEKVGKRRGVVVDPRIAAAKLN